MRIDIDNAHRRVSYFCRRSAERDVSDVFRGLHRHARRGIKVGSGIKDISILLFARVTAKDLPRPCFTQRDTVASSTATAPWQESSELWEMPG
jgi:hypothetical protein